MDAVDVDDHPKRRRRARDARVAASHAATDVTGLRSARPSAATCCAASGVSAEIDAAAVPLLPKAAELAARGSVPGGTKRNRDALGEHVRFDPAVLEPMRVLLFDAQTSGGLLIAVPQSIVRRD